jgi:hypothetical protein
MYQIHQKLEFPTDPIYSTGFATQRYPGADMFAILLSTESVFHSAFLVDYMTKRRRLSQFQRHI